MCPKSVDLNLLLLQLLNVIYLSYPKSSAFIVQPALLHLAATSVMKMRPGNHKLLAEGMFPKEHLTHMDFARTATEVILPTLLITQIEFLKPVIHLSYRFCCKPVLFHSLNSVVRTLTFSCTSASRPAKCVRCRHVHV